MAAARKPEVDSRQYIFSYLIRSAEDVPADFPIPEPGDFRIGLFLPRNDPDWFGRSAYPPRMLLLDADAVRILTHPRYNEPPSRVALSDIVFYEIGRILLIGWIRFVTPRSGIHLPYNTRSDRPVSEFLDSLIQEYLAGGTRWCKEAAIRFGPPLDIKFRNCLTTAMRPGEHLCSMWFSPPHEMSRRWGPFRLCSEAGGDLVAYTDQRVLWITDRCNGRYERYGSVVAAAPVRGIMSAQCQRDGDKASVTISLHSGASWSIPFPSERLEGAEAFTGSVERLSMRTARSGRQ